MTKDEQIAALRAALAWVVDSGGVYSPAYYGETYTIPASWRDAGCGCCSEGPMDVPPEIWATIKEVIS